MITKLLPNKMSDKKCGVGRLEHYTSRKHKQSQQQ